MHLAGIVRAWQAAKSVELPLIIGSEVRIENGPKLVLLVENLEGYQALCRLITRPAAYAKGQYQVLREDFSEPLPGLLALWVPDAVDDFAQGRWLKQVFAERCGWRCSCTGAGRCPAPGGAAELAGRCGFRGGQRRCAHARSRAARLAGHHDRDPPSPAGGRCRIAPAPQRRAAPAQPRRLARSVSAALLDETLNIARRCTFDLGQLRYQYPRELVPEGHSAASWLRQLTERGMRERWPGGASEKVRRQIDKNWG
jgi:error-prone DNA polymerase